MVISVPVTLIAAVVADVYEKVPGMDEVTVGAVGEYTDPYVVLEVVGQVRVGVSFATCVVAALV